MTTAAFVLAIIYLFLLVVDIGLDSVDEKGAASGVAIIRILVGATLAILAIIQGVG